jgi:hypothetical protein
MKKAIVTSVVAVNLIFSALPAVGGKSISINQLFLQNFVDTHCQNFKPLKAVIELNESFYNKVGFGVGAVSCKGEICWSWERGKGPFDWKLYSSNLPVRFSNIEKISKNITQTVKNSYSLRRDASSIVNAAQEFLQTSFGAVKEHNISKERTITESKSQESSVETNITALFHRFLSMGLQNTLHAIYPFCFSAATDLFYKAYNTNRVNDLIEAFTFFQTVQPTDLRFSNEKSFLNRAKLLYLITEEEAQSSEQKRFAWASAILFSKLLEWDEFQDVRKIVDDYIDKVYEKYQLLKAHTTKELLELDKELAVFKYAVDAQLQLENKTQDISEIEDRYAMLATLKFFDAKLKEKLIKELQGSFEEALKKKDPLLDAKLVKEDTVLVKIIKENPKAPKAAGAGAGGAVIGIAGVAGALYFKKKKQKKSENA